MPATTVDSPSVALDKAVPEREPSRPVATTATGRRLLATLGVLALVPTAAAAQSDPTPAWPAVAAAERLGLDLCRREGIEEPLLCGTMTVPADRRGPGGATIDVAFLVVPAQDHNPDTLAWTEHQGGPGRTVLRIARLFAAGGPLEHFRESRDILLFDQRGVGESQGLHCAALTTPRVLRAYFTQESVTACRDEMADAGLLSADYSTIAAVDDLESIRSRLGYPRLDVGGWSYGSRFMLTYAHRYPERVRTISVFVPTPIDYRRPVDWARFAEVSLEGMFADCAAAPACATDQPDLRADWTALRRRVEGDPPLLRFDNPYTGMADSAPLTMARLIDEVSNALLRVSRTRALPRAIQLAAAGDFGAFLELVVPSDGSFTPLAEATYLSIVCPEETAFIDDAAADRLAAGTFTGRHFVDEFQMACDIWGAGPHPEYPLDVRRSDTPILIVAGGRDPITPIEYGERIAEDFSRATVLAVEHMPHDTGGLPGAPECLDRILLEFITAGRMDGIDVRCASELPSAFAGDDP